MVVNHVRIIQLFLNDWLGIVRFCVTVCNRKSNVLTKVHSSPYSLSSGNRHVYDFGQTGSVLIDVAYTKPLDITFHTVDRFDVGIPYIWYFLSIFIVTFNSLSWPHVTCELSCRVKPDQWMWQVIGVHYSPMTDSHKSYILRCLVVITDREWYERHLIVVSKGFSQGNICIDNNNSRVSTQL